MCHKWKLSIEASTNEIQLIIVASSTGGVKEAAWSGRLLMTLKLDCVVLGHC